MQDQFRFLRHLEEGRVGRLRHIPLRHRRPRRRCRLRRREALRHVSGWGLERPRPPRAPRFNRGGALQLERRNLGCDRFRRRGCGGSALRDVALGRRWQVAGEDDFSLLSHLEESEPRASLVEFSRRGEDGRLVERLLVQVRHLLGCLRHVHVEGDFRRAPPLCHPAGPCLVRVGRGEVLRNADRDVFLVPGHLEASFFGQDHELFF